jgi:hypothetical protein
LHVLDTGVCCKGGSWQALGASLQAGTSQGVGFLASAQWQPQGDSPLKDTTSAAQLLHAPHAACFHASGRYAWVAVDGHHTSSIPAWLCRVSLRLPKQTVGADVPLLPPLVCCCCLQPDRAVLGDIVLWFAASAVAEPSATLVMAQATRQDKAWLSG